MTLLAPSAPDPSLAAHTPAARPAAPALHAWPAPMLGLHATLASRAEPLRHAAAIEVLVAHRAPLIKAGLVSVLGRADDLRVTALETSEDYTPANDPPGGLHRVIVTDYETALPLLSDGGVYGASGARSRILIVTRRDRDADVALALRAGADGYCVLGAGVDELVRAVRALAHGGHYLCEAVSGAVAARAGAEAPRGRPSGGLPPGALKRVREHIEQRLADKIELRELAAIARLSECHFSRAFKQSVGMPPHRFLMQERVRVAAELIARTDRSLTEISLDVGFSDQSHFTRTFARATGETPRAYRHRHR